MTCCSRPRDVQPGLGADAGDVFGGHGEQVFDLLRHVVGHGGGQVDLVDHWHDGQVLFERGEEMRHRLRLDALRRIDDEHGAFAGLQCAMHFVAKIDVAGRVDQVDLVLLAVVFVDHAHGAGLDRDPLLALQIHGVEKLLAHLALGDGVGHLDQPVGQRALAVVNVGDNRKVADMVSVHAGNYTLCCASGMQCLHPGNRVFYQVVAGTNTV
jgi:hypothetical protein